MFANRTRGPKRLEAKALGGLACISMGSMVWEVRSNTHLHAWAAIFNLTDYQQQLERFAFEFVTAAGLEDNGHLMRRQRLHHRRCRRALRTVHDAGDEQAEPSEPEMFSHNRKMWSQFLKRPERISNRLGIYKGDFYATKKN